MKIDRKEILEMEDEKLLSLVNQKFGTNIGSFNDREYLSQAWAVAERFMDEGWRFDVLAGKYSKRVDALIVTEGKPWTIFSQYGYVPEFRSVVEGIFKVALIISE